MEVQKRKRDSNLELLRIISMIFIMIHHYAMFTNIDIFVGHNSLIKYLLISVGKIGVNCFILITGYFMITSDFKFKKLLKLILENLFYSIGFMLLFYLFRGISFNKDEIFSNCMPIISTANWFITTYVVLYLATPIINIALKSLTKKQYLSTIFIALLIFSIIPTLLRKSLAFSDLIWFIVLYMIAGFIKLYPNKLFNSLKFNMLICIIFYCFMFGTIIYGNHMKYAYWDVLFYEDMNKFPLVIVSISLFLIFKNLNMKENKFINFVAQSTLGVCLIHENYLVAPVLWTEIFNNANLSSFKLLFHCAFSITCIYIVCTIIDKLRFYIFEKPFFKILDKLQYYIQNKLNLSFRKYLIHSLRRKKIRKDVINEK